MTGNNDFTALLNQISNAATTIESLPGDFTLDLSGSKATIGDGGTFTGGSTDVPNTVIALDGSSGITFGEGEIKGESGNTVPENDIFIMTFSGTNVVDILVGDGQNLSFNNFTLIIEGNADTQVIFRLPDGDFNLSQANILVSPEMDLNSVIFYLGHEGHTMNLQDMIANGIAFWNLGYLNEDAENLGLVSGIDADNAQGCVQMIAEQIDLQDVRFSRCAASMETEVPEPASLGLFGIGLLAAAGVGVWSRRRRQIVAA